MGKSIKNAAKNNFPLSPTKWHFFSCWRVFTSSSSFSFGITSSILFLMVLRFPSPFFITKVMEIIVDFSPQFSLCENGENEVKFHERKSGTNDKEEGKKRKARLPFHWLLFLLPRHRLKVQKSKGIYNKRHERLCVLEVYSIYGWKNFPVFRQK